MSITNYAEYGWLLTALIYGLIITITIFSNLIGALSVGMKSDSEIGQLAVIGYLKSHSYITVPH